MVEGVRSFRLRPGDTIMLQPLTQDFCIFIGVLGTAPATFYEISPDEITDKRLYLNRRVFMRGGALAASMAATGLLYRKLNPPPLETPKGETLINVAKLNNDEAVSKGFAVKEALTPLAQITNYNNFYEFSTSKRCVEGWSMVIPWIGFPLARVLELVEPTSAARFVAFQTLFDPQRMPNQQTGVLDWPYVEGLRLDEALHPLTILATGLYDEKLPPQDGAPIRLVVPWKYGFKSIKSVVKINLVADQPPTTWNLHAPGEYGFYSNANPHVSHPRWSQATELRIGDYLRRDTLMFNGYEAQVAHLYAGMDLRRNF